MTGPDGFTLDAAANVVISGAGNGIGRATALLAAQRGLGVSLWDLEADSLEATCAQLPAGTRVHRAVGDVGDAAFVAESMARARAELGPLRHLANIAGPSATSTLPFAEFLDAAVGTVKLMTDAWVETGLPDDAAMVVTASVAGNLVATDSPGYTASKAAITGYVRHLAAYRADEFRANAVGPGLIDTRRTTGLRESELGQRILARIPLHRLGEPSEIAEVLLFLLSTRASYVNGILVPVDGGWTITQ